MLRQPKFKYLVVVSVLAFVWQSESVEARGFRVGLIPNGSENNCANCHNNAGGGGPRTPFGQDVRSLVGPSSRDAFWDAALAAKDSDGDGFSNGVELGDVDGDGVPERTVNISHPGDGNNGPTVTLGDCNFDTTLDAHDLSCLTSIEDRDAVLASLQTLPGDIDGDGMVAFADFLVLSNNFGQDRPAYTDGNIDLVGSVDFADFLVLSNNFGQTQASTLSAVPEPSAGVLCMFGFGVLSLVRRKPLTRMLIR